MKVKIDGRIVDCFSVEVLTDADRITITPEGIIAQPADDKDFRPYLFKLFEKGGETPTKKNSSQEVPA